MDDPQPEIVEIILHEAVGGDIEKMLGGGELRHVFLPERQIVFLDKLEKTVQLRGDEEGIDRMGENHQLRPLHRLPGGGHVLFKGRQGRADIEIFKMMGGKAFFKVQAALQRHAEAGARRAVDEQDLHILPPVFLISV